MHHFIKYVTSLILLFGWLDDVCVVVSSSRDIRTCGCLHPSAPPVAKIKDYTNAVLFIMHSCSYVLRLGTLASSSIFHHSKKLSTLSTSMVREFIDKNTVISVDHLTPEIKLRLITPDCKLWHCHNNECEIEDPFWAFYWPGGQTLSRYLLDNPILVKNKVVVDIGTGCGASAIAAKLNGAKQVIANDICPVAIEALKINASLNHVELETNTDNLIGSENLEWDVILLGDMFYDQEFTNHITGWIEDLCSTKQRTILIGDPGRIYFKDHPVKKYLTLLYRVELLQHSKDENYGMTHGFVWKYGC